MDELLYMYTGCEGYHALYGKKSCESEKVYAVAKAFIFVAMVIMVPNIPKYKAWA